MKIVMSIAEVSSFIDFSSLSSFQSLPDSNKESDYVILRNEIHVAKPMLIKKLFSCSDGDISKYTSARVQKKILPN